MLSEHKQCVGDVPPFAVLVACLALQVTYSKHLIMTDNQNTLYQTVTLCLMVQIKIPPSAVQCN